MSLPTPGASVGFILNPDNTLSTPPPTPGAAGAAEPPASNSHHRLAALLALAVLSALRIRTLRSKGISQDPQNPTLSLSQLHNNARTEEPYLGKGIDWMLNHSAVLRSAVIAETVKLVGDGLHPALAWAAQAGVHEALSYLDSMLFDRGKGPVLYGPSIRRELASQSSLVSRRWAAQYSTTLAEGLGGPSADGLLVSLSTAQRSGYPAAVTWRVLHAAAGLPFQETTSVWNVAKQRLDRVLTTRRPVAATDIAADVGKLLLSARAKRIVDNESVVAHNFGRQIVLMTAQSKGLLPADARKVWVTAVDERVCPVCAPMDSVAVAIDAPFTVRGHHGVLHSDQQLWVPPAHTNCRCTVVPESAISHGIITRTARFSNTQGRARLVSELADIVHQASTPPWMEETVADQTA